MDSDTAPRRAVAATPKRGSRPFYQLYLVRGTESEVENHRGEQALYLTEADPRRCAMLLEMLYIPVGRSGSSDECYLLYENFDEFEAATRFAPNLDVSSPKVDGAPVGAEAAFAAGVAMFLDIAGQGAVVDRPSVEACERHLAQAVQSAQFSPLLRWAAGILAGRIASEYRYDYASAGSYYRQAERLAPQSSLERMTSQWWLADALTMEGKFEEANAARQSILAEYESHWQGSHITRRARAIVRQDGDR